MCGGLIVGVCKDGGQSHQAMRKRREMKRREKMRERLKGQCELSKLAVLLGDAKRGRREKRKEKRDGERWRLAQGRGAGSCGTYGVARVMEKLPSRVERDWRLGG